MIIIFGFIEFFRCPFHFDIVLQFVGIPSLRINNWVLSLTREGKQTDQDLDTLQVITPPFDTPSRTVYVLT